jgi:DNA polymerase (family 10)
MINKEIIKIFYEIADILEMQNVKWKPNAYRNAARAIEILHDSLKEIYEKGGIKALEDIPGIGEGLAKKIVQYIKTGKINEYERLRRTVPKHILDLMDIPGLGAKRAKILYEKLGIKSVKDLEKAVKQHKIAKLFSFGEKSEENIIRNLETMKTSEERRPLNEVLQIANKIIKELKNKVEKIVVAGSIRRKKAMVRDIDILAISKNPEPVMNYFTKMKNVDRILGKGKTKSTVILDNGIQADLRIVPEKSFGAALQYFTGSKDYNIKLREIAIKKGYKLNEYGLFERKTGKMVAGETEKEIFKILGVKYIEPEKRISSEDVRLLQ